MKRKIAILLSAMMVTSAMPITASAAQLKADSVLNTTFGKANETIDAKADKYTTYSNVEDLKSRRSVVKVALNNDGTNSINEEISFKVNLENGTFDENNKARYEYVNASPNGTRVDYDTAMGTKGTAAKSLTEVYTNISNAGKEEVLDKIQLDQNIAFSSITAGHPLEGLKSAIEHVASTVNKAQFAGANSMETFLAKPDAKHIKDAFDAVVKVVVAENTTSGVAPDLAHIPYKISIDSPTTATITVPNLNLSDSDKTINFGAGTSLDSLKIKLSFLKTGASAEVTGGEFAEIGQSGSTTIDGIKIVTTGAQVEVKGKEVKDPFIALPLGAVKADGNAPVKAKITSAYNDKVVGGEYTITSSIQEGDTNLVYDSNNVKSFEDYGKLAPVVIQENVRGTIGNNKDTAEVTLRLNGGFRFKTTAGDKGTNDTTLKVYDDKTGKLLTVEKVSGQSSYFSANDSVIRFVVKGLGADRVSPIGLRIEGLFVEPANDKTFGDIELSVSGTGITSKSKVVAKREKLGFKLETLKDPKEIISGRHYLNNDVSMTEADNTTVEVKFSEAVPNTLVESRALDFSVPEGVKIVGMEIEKQNNFASGEKPEQADFEIINNGKTLRLKRDSYKVATDTSNTNSLANFTMKLNLSVDPAFKGDIKLSVTGGGQSDVTETVIAKAVIPFEIKSQSTKLNIGYQDYNTADIVITEARPGMFLENKTAVLSLAAPYGTQELGFSEAKFEVSGGELEVKEKDFKVGESNGEKGTINFKINKASYKNPSTITIKNVKVGTTRSVPFGAYDLKLKGDAVINNYKSDVKDDKSFDVTSKDVNLVNQNNTSSYDFKNYVEVITETGTLDKTVKVSVGEKTVLVGDQAIDMDVAPYIQASSNSTMVPLRFVSVALGVDTGNVANPDASNKIAWDANTKTTTIYYGAGTGQKIIQFQAGSNIMTVDGTRIPMEYGVKAEIKDGRMFVPFRALGQALGVNVSWDADSRTAIYNENNARNSNTTTTATTASTTTESTTASTTKESSTESTTASDKTTETTTKKTN